MINCCVRMSSHPRVVWFLVAFMLTFVVASTDLGCGGSKGSKPSPQPLSGTPVPSPARTFDDSVVTFQEKPGLKYSIEYPEQRRLLTITHRFKGISHRSYAGLRPIPNKFFKKHQLVRLVDVSGEPYQIQIAAVGLKDNDIVFLANDGEHGILWPYFNAVAKDEGIVIDSVSEALEYSKLMIQLSDCSEYRVVFPGSNTELLQAFAKDSWRSRPEGYPAKCLSGVTLRPPRVINGQIGYRVKLYSWSKRWGDLTAWNLLLFRDGTVEGGREIIKKKFGPFITRM